MKKKKRAITLLEIMIVILLIGIISSVVGYNMRGSLEKGKKFKTDQAKAQIRDILLLEVANGKSMQTVIDNPVVALRESGLVKDAEKLVYDGWGNPLIVRVNPKDPQDIEVMSMADQQANAQ